MQSFFALPLVALATLFAGLDVSAEDGRMANVLVENSALRTSDEEPLLVVVFLGPECPLARLYAIRLNELAERYRPRGVGFLAVDSNAHDDEPAMAELAGRLQCPLVRDADQRLADALGATRSPEAILLDRDRQIVYQGRIDDQYAPGVHGRSAPLRRDLEEAIVETLDRRPVTIRRTDPAGCLIDRAAQGATAAPARKNDAERTTYARDVAPILDARCVECHRAGGAAPFTLTTYEDAVAWRDTIREVVHQRRMPPWGAEGGDFINDRSLSVEQREKLDTWLAGGTPEGDPGARPPAPVFADDWSIRADRVLTMAQPFAVPAEGVLDYQEFAIDPGFASDTWVAAVEIRPGCREVVHHINVYVKPKGAPPDRLFMNSLGDYYLAMAVPGNTITTMPPGAAKRVPAAWEIVLSVHYVPNGVARQDRSSVALTLCDVSQVHREMATRALLDDHLVIEANTRKQVTHSFTCEDDFTVFALYPHMHLRGRSMLFEARYPDGRQEVLLNVARYDFAWQYRYVLRTPKDLPRGTVVSATALYDNTADNPNNPDPNTVVRAGRQTTDEMFQACFEICRTHEDLLAGRAWWPIAAGWLALAAAGAVGFHRAVMNAKRHTRRTRQSGQPIEVSC